MARGQETETVAMMSRLCYDLLLRYGSEALDGVKRGEYTPALEKVVEANILLSGVGFERRPCGGPRDQRRLRAGAAGAWHVPRRKGRVWRADPACAAKADAQTLEEVLGFTARVEAPMTLAQLGVTEIRRSPAQGGRRPALPTQSTKNLSPDITAEDVYRRFWKRTGSVGSTAR